MWKLSIIQKKPFTASEGTYDVEVEFVSKGIGTLFAVVDRLAECGAERETSFLIEKVEEEEKNG